jgi:hypothetical protein
MISPSTIIPRSIPDYMSPNGSGSRDSPNPKPHYSRSPSSQRRPISPPKTRSASAEDSSAALVEDWRAYTSKLRSQSDGERAHMMADRARADEVMAEERALWDKERDILKARIAELELELEKALSGPVISPPLSQRERPGQQQEAFRHGSSGSNAISSAAGSVDSAPSRLPIPQESGRNADGSPFYAPAPRNPSRTFEPSELTALRVDTISAARESPIRVTSKELTPSDFGVQSPLHTLHEPLQTIPETPIESIDISHIQPELEGVSIRTSALSPKFTAKILSPQNHSPAKLSPNIKPPAREFVGRENLNPLSRDRSLSPNGRSLSPNRRKPDVPSMMLQPETRRLTMHAGHTPNHSISKLGDFLGESGSATPTQVNTSNNHAQTSEPHFDDREHEDEQGDRELSGPLGLTNHAEKDDAFLAQLVEKLEEARKSEGVSPSEESVSSRRSDEEVVEKVIQEAEEEDIPPLRLKPSLNFGRPIGRM